MAESHALLARTDAVKAKLKRKWIKPHLKRLRAGDAEVTSGPAFDGGVQS
jgi:hypothetical protein